MDKITINGIEYLLNNCSEIYLEPIVDFYNILTTGNAEQIDFALINKVCQVLKEVLLPDLPDAVISVNQRDRYLWNLDFSSLAVAILDTMKIRIQAKINNPETYSQDLETGVKFINLFRAALLKDDEGVDAARKALDAVLPKVEPDSGENEIKRQIEELRKKLPATA